MRRAQAEILGIAIAVVILILVVVIVVGLSSSGPKKPDVVKEVTYSKLAWSFVNAIVSTSYNEGGTIGEALAECGINKNNVCAVKNTIENILSDSLKKRNEQYIFTAKYGDDTVVSYGKIDSCRNTNYGEVVISTRTGIPLKVGLKICIR